MPLISPSSPQHDQVISEGDLVFAQKKEAASSSLFFQLKMRSFNGLLLVTQPHRAEGAGCCVTVLQHFCTAYTINHSGEINYSHPLGTNSQVEEED